MKKLFIAIFVIIAMASCKTSYEVTTTTTDKDGNTTTTTTKETRKGNPNVNGVGGVLNAIQGHGTYQPYHRPGFRL